MGFWILVQSDKQGCSYLRNSVDKCLEKNRENLKTMTDEEFDKQRNSVLTNLEEKDKNQKEEFSRLNNGEISQHRLMWDRQQKEIEMIKTLTKAEFIDYFEKMLYTERKRVDLRWNSDKHKEDEEKTEFKITDGSERQHANLDEFKSSMGLFPDQVHMNYCLKYPKL